MHTAVTAYFSSKQLVLFVFELQDSLLLSSTGLLIAVQRQTTETDYILGKQLLLIYFCSRPTQQIRDVQPMLVQCWVSGEDDGLTLMVIAQFSSENLLLFVFAVFFHL